MAELRTRATATLTPTAQAKMDNSGATFANDQALQASAASEFSRGWNAAGLGEQANKLLWNAASAYQVGDAVAGQDLQGGHEGRFGQFPCFQHSGDHEADQGQGDRSDRL